MSSTLTEVPANKGDLWAGVLNVRRIVPITLGAVFSQPPLSGVSLAVRSILLRMLYMGTNSGGGGGGTTVWSVS